MTEREEIAALRAEVETLRALVLALAARSPMVVYQPYQPSFVPSYPIYPTVTCSS